MKLTARQIAARRRAFNALMKKIGPPLSDYTFVLNDAGEHVVAVIDYAGFVKHANMVIEARDRIETIARERLARVMKIINGTGAPDPLAPRYFAAERARKRRRARRYDSPGVRASRYIIAARKERARRLRALRLRKARRVSGRHDLKSRRASATTSRKAKR